MREFLNFISLFKILMTSPTKFLIVSQILKAMITLFENFLNPEIQGLNLG